METKQPTMTGEASFGTTSGGQKRPRQLAKMPAVPQEWCLELPSEGKSGENTFGGCRRIEDAYERVGQLGQGTYGEVFKAKDKETGEIVAVKKIKMENEKEGFPITAVREIKILSKLAASDQELQGELMRNNIIRLREIVRSDAHASNSYKGSVFMVFDYMEHDLAGLLDRANQARVADAKSRGLPANKADPPFHMGQVKRYMKQLLLGLALLQFNRILHRDLKNANLLVSNKGELKIADFGLARSFYHRKVSDDKDGLKPSQPGNGPSLTNMTNRVITLWYRPPELCLGTEQYGLEVDMWSAGCILVEMLTGRPLFPGKDEVEQVKLICSVLGMPNEVTMPGCTTWKDFRSIMDSLSNVRFRDALGLRHLLHSRGIFDEHAIDLIEKLLFLNPAKRIDAREAAGHPWFSAEPKMFELSQMPRYEESHELAMKMKRNQGKATGKPDHYKKSSITHQPVQHSRPHGQDARHRGASFPPQGAGNFRGSHRSLPKWHEERR